MDGRARRRQAMTVPRYRITSRYPPISTQGLLNSQRVRRIVARMSRIAPIIAVSTCALLCAGAAQAACEVEYKAKRDKPLELYYDVMTVDAPCASAEAALRARLAARGLTLLKILSKRET